MPDPLWPLFDRFPRLAGVPRVALRQAVTPIEQVEHRLWIKRDDLTAAAIGGNKVRALELLLGGIEARERIVTAGARGSTHALSTAILARALGADTLVAWWPQEMNDVASAVSRRLDGEAERRRFANPLFAMAWLEWRRLRGDRVIPAGGTSPLGILGHVNAALELAQQVREGAMPMPQRLVVPLGTGGTAAGLALGFTLAGLRTTIIAARVVPRVVGRASRVRRLMRATQRLIGRLTGEHVDLKPTVDIQVLESVYGGAYGRPLPGADAIAGRLPPAIRVDPTYSAKAFVAAVDAARDADTLFWMTFDSRWITSGK